VTSHRPTSSWAVALLAVAALAGCSVGAGGGPATDGPSGAPTATPPAAATPGASEVRTAATEVPSDAPAWAVETLTDVRAGSSLRLVDLRGRVVFVEGMATWCPPCLDQQREARAALAQLDPAEVVYLSVDVDPREQAPTLAAYAGRHGFDWQFVVATPAFLRLLAGQFGVTVLNPPSTPVLVIDRSGHGTLTEVGIKKADRLVGLARQVGG